MTQKERDICLYFLKRFQIDGKPADEQITKGQLEIFYVIIFKPKNRVQILCSTQYGKSLTVALACVVLTTVYDQVVAVIAPTNEKAKIIMRYYLEHIGDNVLFFSQLGKDTSLDRLRQEESKERIMLRGKGGIFVVSVQSGNTKKTIQAAMGFGAENVIQDESGLIPDDTEATVFRMIAGKKDGFYCKVGNPFYRTKPYLHFWDTWHDENYYKIFIDYNQGIKEGRYNAQFIEEARHKPLFDILFECKFPDEDMMDLKGWVPLLTRQEIEIAMQGAEDLPMLGEKAMGVDPADTGRNESSIVIRGMNVAEIRFSSSQIDLMTFAGTTIIPLQEKEVKTSNAFYDKIGVGAGLVSRVQEQKWPVNAINVAEQAIDQKQFVNLRAEAFWRMRQWIKSGGKLRPNDKWYQLTEVKYKADDSSGRLRIMSKDEMRRNGIMSPDIADALMLTFAKPITTFQKSIEDKFFELKQRQKKLKGQLLVK